MPQQIDPLHHRSKTEIKKWLKTRDWYEKYVENLKIEYNDINNRQQFLWGEQGTKTISGAFCFSDTPEGTKFWFQKEEEFLMWYFYQD